MYSIWAMTAMWQRQCAPPNVTTYMYYQWQHAHHLLINNYKQMEGILNKASYAIQFKHVKEGKQKQKSSILTTEVVL